jgi:hypothetical protein
VLGMPTWMLAGVVCTGLIVLITVLFSASRKLSLLVGVGGLLMTSSMALPVELDRTQVRPTFWLGLQSNREYFYALFGAMTLGLFIFQLKRLVGKRLSKLSVILLLMGVFMAMLRFFHEGMTDGILSMGMALIVLPALLLAPAALIDDESDLPPLLRTILLVNIIWIGMTAVQFVVDRSQVIFGNSNRFVGLLANPQHAATLLACMGTTALWIALNDTNKMWKMIGSAVLAANLVLLIWTGSRTGFGMIVVGSAGVLFSRLGRAVLLMPVVAVFFFVAMQFFGAGVSEASTVIDRFGSSEDTRTFAWLRMIDAARESPLIGVGLAGAGASENSWLYGFAAYGAGMLLLSLVLTVFGIAQVTKAIRRRWGLPVEQQSALDLSAGLVVAYFGGAMFEGFFAARVSPNLVFVMIFSGVLARFLQLEEQRRDDRVHVDDWYEHEEAYGDTYGLEDQSPEADAPPPPPEQGPTQGRPRASW